MRFGNRLLLLPALLLALCMFGVPVALVLEQAFVDPEPGLANFVKFFSRSVYVTVFVNTLSVSAVVATACLLIGYPMALFVAGAPRNRRAILLFLVLVPMWSSILVRTYAWMVVLGREGIVNRLLIWLGLTDEPVTLLFTTTTVYVAMTQVLLPIMILTCYTAMVRIDPGLVRAARIMGAGPFRAFRHVFLPLSLEGAITGWSVIFILSMGFFIIPALVGGRRDTLLGNMIVNQVGQANWGFAGAMALILLVATVLLLALVQLLTRRLTFSEREALA